MWKQKTVALAVITIWFSALPGVVSGAVDLRFEPLDQHIVVAQEATLSIMLDEPLEVRTIEVTVTYDGSVLAGTGGGGGAAFHDLPCYIWEEYSPEENQWTGFAVSMGVDCFVVGPGELFVWNFVGSAEGVSPITAVQVTLYDRYALEILDLNLQDTTVVVGNVSAAQDWAPLGRLVITAAPNPANPMTYIKFWLPAPREARLGIFDLKGRQVKSLLAGYVSGQWTSVAWDGRSDAGRDMPSGVYFYRLVTNREALAGRVTLVR